MFKGCGLAQTERVCMTATLHTGAASTPRVIALSLERQQQLSAPREALPHGAPGVGAAHGGRVQVELASAARQVDGKRGALLVEPVQRRRSEPRRMREADRMLGRLHRA